MKTNKLSYEERVQVIEKKIELLLRKSDIERHYGRGDWMETFTDKEILETDIDDLRLL